MPQRAVVRAVERLCRDAVDERALRVAVLDLLVPELRLDAWAWLLTDPVTAVGTSPVAVVPWFSELPAQVRWKYLSPVNRWTGLRGAVARLHDATGGDLAQSDVWREVLRSHGVVDAASVVLQDRWGTWGFLELWRCAPTAPFDPHDAALLTEVAPVLTAALRRLVATAFDGPTDSAAAPVVLVLDDQLDVRAQTPQTEALLRRLLPVPPGAAPVPAVAYNAAAQLLALEAGVDVGAASARLGVGEGRWITARATRLGSDIAVVLSPATGAERLEVFVRATGLSDREGELVGHLVEGCDTREVAARMVLSEHTVQDHLKAVFDKSGVRSRRALLARALGA
ncbi:MAG: helix-turn-helix transcriptional regulator [Mycobacteriales bacterium]|nr:helix-turn-helix transcriptional regulator [Mycobacteriales bacterium]